jgi:hypothetical protein
MNTPFEWLVRVDPNSLKTNTVRILLTQEQEESKTGRRLATKNPTMNSLAIMWSQGTRNSCVSAITEKSQVTIFDNAGPSFNVDIVKRIRSSEDEEEPEPSDEDLDVIEVEEMSPPIDSLPESEDSKNCIIQ